MVEEALALGRVQGGKLELNSRDFLAQRISRLSDGEVVVRVTRRKAKRSERANNYYFGVVVAMVADYTGEEPEDVHEAIKREVNAKRVELVNKQTGEVHETWVGGSTANMNVSDYWEFVERARAFAAQFFGLEIPDPEPDPELRRPKKTAEARPRSARQELPALASATV